MVKCTTHVTLITLAFSMYFIDGEILRSIIRELAKPNPLKQLTKIKPHRTLIPITSLTQIQTADKPASKTGEDLISTIANTKTALVNDFISKNENQTAEPGESMLGTSKSIIALQISDFIQHSSPHLVLGNVKDASDNIKENASVAITNSQSSAIESNTGSDFGQQGLTNETITTNNESNEPSNIFDSAKKEIIIQHIQSEPPNIGKYHVIAPKEAGSTSKNSSKGSLTSLAERLSDTYNTKQENNIQGMIGKENKLSNIISHNSATRSSSALNIVDLITNYSGTRNLNEESLVNEKSRNTTPTMFKEETLCPEMSKKETNINEIPKTSENQSTNIGKNIDSVNHNSFERNNHDISCKTEKSIDSTLKGANQQESGFYIPGEAQFNEETHKIITEKPSNTTALITSKTSDDDSIDTQALDKVNFNNDGEAANQTSPKIYELKTNGYLVQVQPIVPEGEFHRYPSIGKPTIFYKEAGIESN